ncbi:hypothetical protein PR048_011519 [Dryococelus australis]|uniref:Uncharacterized protein n=1 Tax=Dryococelus australis TaxID=614101 RepID=A0ABQ9HM53_9NEOP|nr:hypothetical protein PR048_011519 [Dryococelus australis]
MNCFAFNEMVDMHLCYDAAHSNAYAARRLYAQLFPWHVIPSHVYFSIVYCRLHETGSLQGHVVKYVRCCDARDPLEETLLERVAEDPWTSIRVVAGQLGNLHTTV